MSPPLCCSDKSSDPSSLGLQVVDAVVADVGGDAAGVAAEAEAGAAAVDAESGCGVAEIGGLPGKTALLGYGGRIVDLLQMKVVQNSSLDHHLASIGLLPTSAAEPPLAMHRLKLNKQRNISFGRQDNIPKQAKSECQKCRIVLTFLAVAKMKFLSHIQWILKPVFSLSHCCFLGNYIYYNE